MEERDHEIPVATLRPRRLSGRLVSLRGALGRWLVGRARNALRGRHAPLLLTGVVFSGMMLAMGYVAERANRAADAIDTMHRSQRDWMEQQRRRAAVYDVELADPQEVAASASADPWSAAVTRPRAKPLFYVRR